MSGIYIHIPFCKQACSYCDFYFVTRTELRDRYVEKLVDEIRSYRHSLYTEEHVRTIYIGGGTPSLLSPAHLERILEALDEVFPLQLQEVTVEMNPDDVSKAYLAALKQAGVNRASMGVQSFKPELLEFMNRAHNREEALKSLELLSQSGFETFTVDLIYGNPDQSLKDLADDLDLLLGFDPPHVSAYSLTIESKTRLGKQVALGRIDPPGDDVVADHFDLVVDKLEEQGIIQYEVSNYSRPGHRAVHNSNYWRHKNYLGLGPAAHSFWWNDDGAERRANKPDLKEYLDSGNRSDMEELTMDQLAEERIMLGLRTREGVEIAELKERYGYGLNSRQSDYLEQRQQEGKAEFSDSIRLTRQGLKIADAVILDLLTLH